MRLYFNMIIYSSSLFPVVPSFSFYLFIVFSVLLHIFCCNFSSFHHASLFSFQALSRYSRLLLFLCIVYHSSPFADFSPFVRGLCRYLSHFTCSCLLFLSFKCYLWYLVSSSLPPLPFNITPSFRLYKIRFSVSAPL